MQAEQIKLVTVEALEAIKARDVVVLDTRIEGEQVGEWVLVDLGSVIVHIMQPAVRDYYKLEQLWGGEPERRTATPRRGKDVLAADAGSGSVRL